MEAVGEYLLRVTVCALVCGVLTGILGGKGLPGAMVKLLCGIFMTLAVLNPLLGLRLESLTDFTGDFSLDAEAFAADGKNAALEAQSDIIKERVRAYILDKAESLGVELTVEVTLKDADPPVPCGVRLTGRIAPYEKGVLSRMIADDLAVAVEDQIWIG